MTDADIAELKQLWCQAERKYAGIHKPNSVGWYDGTGPGHTLVQFRESSVIVTAPHAVNHYNGLDHKDFKWADGRTGGLAEALSEVLQVSCATHTLRVPAINPRLGKTGIDKAIEQVVDDQGSAIVLDLHACREAEGRDFDIAIGTGPDVQDRQMALVDAFYKGAEEFGLRVALNFPGLAGDGYGETMVMRHRDNPQVTIIQVEMMPHLRELSTPSSNRTIPYFVSVVEKIWPNSPSRPALPNCGAGASNRHFVATN